MKTEKVGIICGNGIGDGLIMMVVAAHLQTQSQITIFHEKHQALSILFPKLYHWDCYAQGLLTSFDLIIMQYDGSQVAHEILHLRGKKNFPQVIIFFPYKHPKSQNSDIIFDRSKTMVDNITSFMKHKFPRPYSSNLPKNNLLIPKGEYRKYSHRIAIHPTSANRRKNWTPIQFVILAKKLRICGYFPVFLVSLKENYHWKSFLPSYFPLHSFADLSDVSSYLYESGAFIGNDSGLGHLASNLQIPTLTIFSKKSLSPLWNPGFGIHKVLLPYPIPNWKGLSLCFREWCWPICITTRKVMDKFFLLMQEI